MTRTVAPIMAFALLSSWACGATAPMSETVQQHEQRIAILESRLAQIQSALEAAHLREESLKVELAKLSNLLEQFEELQGGTAADGEPAAYPDGSTSPSDASNSAAGAVRTSPFEFRHLTVDLQSFEVLRASRVQSILVFGNSHPTLGLVIAHRAVNSDRTRGLPVWKILPEPIGRVASNLGHEFSMVRDCVLGCARDRDDWLTLAPGERVTKTLIFDAESPRDPADVYSMSFDVRMATGIQSLSDETAISVVFRGLRPRSAGAPAPSSR